MIKRRKRAKMGVRQETRARSTAHLQWVRGHECAIPEATHWFKSRGRIEAHHVRVAGDGTTGKKPGDDKTVPLCGVHHEEGHRIGWKSFETRYRVNLTEIAAELARRSPHLIKWRREHDTSVS